MLAPVFAWIWQSMAKRGTEPSSSAKFALGLIFAGLGFAILIGPARMSEQGVLASPMWLTLTYLLHTIGELALSPVGLSAMTVLAPPRIAGLVMGVWFLATSVGNFIGGRVAVVLRVVRAADAVRRHRDVRHRRRRDPLRPGPARSTGWPGRLRRQTVLDHARIASTK